MNKQILKAISNLEKRVVDLYNKLKVIPKPTYKVFTALLSQSGGDNVIGVSGEGGTVNIGTTYLINENSDNYDLTIYGAPNNDVGTYFVSNQTSILNYTDSLQLVYNEGAPVATVLENTIGNIWFTYDIVGSYYANSNSLFTNNKSTIIVGNPYWETSNGFIKSGFDGESFANIKTSDFSNTGIDDNTLINTPIEIRVYN